MTDTTSKSGQTEVWITGIGLATSLGEGLDANWDALQEKRINVDEKKIVVEAQVPKESTIFEGHFPGYP